ncbi:MAG: cyclic-di-AMP receptor [Clostridia bacterium]|nr:cyclic-di-AMP receptor [Clostridia bacterium]
MKLIIAIVGDEDSTRLTDKLSKNSIPVTKLASTGGFLRAGNVTLMIGTEDDKVEEIIEIIKSVCKSRKEIVAPTSVSMTAAITWPIEITVGGATLFVLDIDRFEKI